MLTMLGIIIGIAAIITIVSTIQGTNEQIKENLIGAGNNVVTVTLNRDGYAYDMSWNKIPEGVRVITEQTRKDLEAIRGVERVSVYHARSYANDGCTELTFDRHSAIWFWQMESMKTLELALFRGTENPAAPHSEYRKWAAWQPARLFESKLRFGFDSGDPCGCESFESFLQLFDGCRWLKSVDVSRWNTANVRDYRGMFHGCQLLQSPDLSGWSRHPQAVCHLMFDGCPRVKTDDWK
jgi:surface protein